MNTDSHLEPGWNAFDREVNDINAYAQNHMLPALQQAPKSAASFGAAKAIGDLLSALVISGRCEEACENAGIAEKYARFSVGRKRGYAELGRGVTEDMAKAEMWFIVYTCRWLRTGTEDVEALRAAMGHAQGAVIADEAKRHARFRATNAAFLSGLALRLGVFDIAHQYAKVCDGLVTYQRGSECKREYRALYLDVCAYLSGNDRDDDLRESILAAFRKVFDDSRKGAEYFVPFGNGIYESLFNLAYFGLRYFDELRNGKQFTLENVCRFIRFD